MIEDGNLEFIGYYKEGAITQATPDTWYNE